MRVLYFGFYDPGYSRNRVLIKGLKANGVEVLECCDKSSGLKKFFNLYKKHRALRNKYDAMVVGFLGHTAVPLAKAVSSKPVIFDAFVSLYDSNVFDRKLIKPRSLKVIYYWFLDWFSMKLADVILFDTDEQIKFVSKKFKVPFPKFKKIFVGTDDDVFRSWENLNIDTSNCPFTVHFHGSFIPLQGVDCIVRAAKLLEKENIKFNILGKGQTYPEIKKLAGDLAVSNINFIDRVEYRELPEYISKGDICLGIFGTTPKANRVIPNKVYEYAATKKPIITADTPAARELFGDDDIILIEPVPEKLASAILNLKSNPDLRKIISENAYKKVKKFANPGVLGKELKEIIKGLI